MNFPPFFSAPEFPGIGKKLKINHFFTFKYNFIQQYNKYYTIKITNPTQFIMLNNIALHKQVLKITPKGRNAVQFLVSKEEQEEEQQTE